MIVHPARKPYESLGSSAGGPAGVDVTQRESRSPVWPLRQLLQKKKIKKKKRSAGASQQHFLYTLECVFSCVYFSVATNLPAGGWSNYQSGLP